MTLTVGSLFSGIGGIDLGLERAGMEVRWQVEVDPWCRRVLAKHWPEVPKYGDIRTISGAELETVDVIAGGFPCQPVSFAGKGLAQDDLRWLWPEFARLVRELRPRFVFMENVPGLLARGFGDVLGDLAACGYDAEWDCIPAAAVGAPHIRDRVWIVAYAQSESIGTRLRESEPAGIGKRRPGDRCGAAHVANAECGGRSWWETSQAGNDDADGANAGRQETVGAVGDSRLLGDPYGASEDTLTATGGPWGAISQSGWWATEPDVGRVAARVPARMDRLRGLGNAVVPQVVQFIGERIVEAAS